MSGRKEDWVYGRSKRVCLWLGGFEELELRISFSTGSSGYPRRRSAHHFLIFFCCCEEEGIYHEIIFPRFNFTELDDDEETCRPR